MLLGRVVRTVGARLGQERVVERRRRSEGLRDASEVEHPPDPFGGPGDHQATTGRPGTLEPTGEHPDPERVQELQLLEVQHDTDSAGLLRGLQPLAQRGRRSDVELAAEREDYPAALLPRRQRQTLHLAGPSLGSHRRDRPRGGRHATGPR